ncbi:MAG: hypothetical protein VKI83_04915 [Synechococcaceae cyanobacterium]|nr:hypothetical protein [Synechococcaceae cyanobacterium]
MSCIDLQIQGNGDGAPITVVVASRGGAEALTVELPAGLRALHQAWLRRFLHHHDPATAAIPAEVVLDYSLRLQSALAEWLQEPSWRSLQQALADQPDDPLRIRIQGSGSWLERLPWEELPFERPIWRLQGSSSQSRRQPLLRMQRTPRMLLLVGDEAALPLEQEITQLEQLQRQGRISLQILRGSGCSIGRIRKALTDPTGWDGLIFLGHSEPDPNTGGRLHLGDGSWMPCGAIEHELQQAAAGGLRMVLLNSCSGIDLAHRCIAAGIPWALCFREAVPTAAATLAFAALLPALEANNTWPQAFAAMRSTLQQSGPAGSQMLLSAYCSPDAADLSLPLQRRRQFRLRLAGSERRQALAAGALALLALVAEIEPANPLSGFLLDRRLYVQRLWRENTGQHGPQAEVLPMVLLNEHSDYQSLGVSRTPGRVSRLALARVLERLPVQQVPRVGLDVALDETAPDTDALAQVIKKQSRKQVFAGYFAPNLDARRAGESSRPLPQLQAAGLEARNLTVGIASSGGKGIKPAPLQLAEPITANTFAGAIAGVDGLIPAEAVIDWSIDWPALVQTVQLEQLAQLQAPVLLVGTDGTFDGDQPDRFQAPGAVRASLPAWGGGEAEMPGAVVQAVLAQSLRLGHWLTPLSLSACTALASGAGVLLAAALQRRPQRLAAVALSAAVAVPLALQLAAGSRILMPLGLPLAALAAVTVLRRR